MKFVRLYMNDAQIFPEITFKDGLNVVFAKVNPASLQHDSHNLGKTLLIHVLNFALLSKIDKTHPFRVHSERFDSFIFSLELETPSGVLVTVRRHVDPERRISINEGKAAPDEADWTHPNMGLDKARAVLDDLLSISLLREHGFTFRKGLRFFLRQQNDYSNAFLLNAYKGKDKDWKPLVALLLGFAPEPLLRKYELAEQEDGLSLAQKQLESSAGAKASDYDELKGTIELRAMKLNRMRAEVNAFSFGELEKEVHTDLVDDVERKISEANSRLYSIGYDLQEIDRSLATKIKFNVAEIQQVFEEAGLYFPKEMMRSYEELIAFNHQISSGRSDRLKGLRQKLVNEKTRIASDLEELDVRRSRALQALTERETLQKYREMQLALATEERRLAELTAQLESLDTAGHLRRKIQETRRQREDLGALLEASVHNPSIQYIDVRRAFSEHVERILGIEAIMVTTVNKEQNLEFSVKTLDKDNSRRETSESRGTSYSKLLAASFDIAVLDVYSSVPFYRFVYHDGIFEGLDNRRKLSLLREVRSFTQRTGTQYILTVIDSDLPRGDDDGKLMFEGSEIIRSLDDGGDGGRLFRMPAF